MPISRQPMSFIFVKFTFKIIMKCLSLVFKYSIEYILLDILSYGYGWILGSVKITLLCSVMKLHLSVITCSQLLGS